MAGKKEELIIRIVPELDSDAVKGVQNQLNAIKPNVSMGATGAGAASGSKQVVAGLKEQQAEMKRVFDNIQQRLIQEDILLRTTRLRIQRDIDGERQKAAQGTITNQQMLQNIERFEAESVQAANNARIAYQGLTQEIDETIVKFDGLDGSINQSNRVQSKLLVNAGHLDSGFVTMATSLGKITSQTKNTNLAFMNLGRIVQDAPFGLIGIANNIDPMVVTFNNLANEIDVTTGKVRGFGGALSAMGKNLLGPAGVIFILGSLIPSALLVLQKHQRNAAKDSDALAEALKRVTDEFGRLAAQAAGKKGIEQVNSELKVTTKTLEIVSKELSDIEKHIETQVALQLAAISDGLVTFRTGKEVRQVFEDQNKELVFRLKTEKESLESNKKNLEDQRQDIQAQIVINRMKKEGGVAATLSLEDQAKLSKRIIDLEIRAIEVVDEKQGEVLRNVQKLKEEIKTIFNDPAFNFGAQEVKTINALRQEITDVQNGVNDKTSEFIDRTIVQQARLNIQADDNLRIANDENKTIEERIRFFNIAMDLQKQETQLKIQSVQAQLLLSKDENERLQFNVQLLILSEKLKDIDRERVKFAKERASEEDKLFLLMQNSALALREADRKITEDILKNREKVLKESERIIVTEQANVAIEQATRKGQILLALELQQNEELRARKQFFMDQQFSEEDAMETAKKEMKIRHAQETADAVVAIEKTKDEMLHDIILTSINAALNLAELGFGKTKGIAVAEAIVNTYTAGAQALAINYGTSPLALPAKIAAMALVLSKGMLNVKTILSTNIGSGASTPSTHATQGGNMAGMMVGGGGILLPRNLIREGVGAMNLAASASPQQNNQTQPININANVDQRGIALAVRQGEQIIRSQQITFV